MSRKPPPLLGSYKTPSFRYGATVKCMVRGDVVIAGLSDARIPWPVGRPHGGRANGYVVYKDLVRALRRESAQAIQYWFGLGHSTVASLRKTLGINWLNEGTRRAMNQAARMPSRRGNIRKAIAKASDPEHRAKVAAALRGRKRPRHLVEAWVRGRHAKPDSEETRRRMSAGQKRRGSWPALAGKPWTAAEDALAQSTLPTKEVAARTGRTELAVRGRRHNLRTRALMPDGSKTMREAAYRAWHQAQQQRRSS